MVRLSLLVVSSLVLTACQDAKMSGAKVQTAPVQSAVAPPANQFPPGPQPQPPMPPPPIPPQPPVVNLPPEPPINYPPPPPRTPEVEPVDPRVVTPPTTTFPPRPPVITTTTPTVDTTPSNPPPRPVPPSVVIPEDIQPLPSTPAPGPNPGPVIPAEPISLTQPPPRPANLQLPGPQPLPIPPARPEQPFSTTQPPPRPVGLNQAEPQLQNAPVPQPRPANLKVADPEPKMVSAPMPQPRPQDLKIKETAQPIGGQCGPVPLEVSTTTKEAKLDVLFVVDTSASLTKGSTGQAGELARIAAQMDHFVANFPENTDINVGVMLGHGKTDYTGKLFKSSAGDPAVLKTSEIRNRADLVRRLEDKMKKVPNESGGAQGEALLYSLYRAVNEKELRNLAIGQGMFRNDATLAVVLISDEQDVCFDYKNSKNPKTGKAYLPVGKHGVIGKPDPTEADFFKDVCSKAYKKTQLLEPKHVHKALLSLKGSSNRLVLMGMVYTDSEVKAGKEDENEMGHGIIELVRDERTEVLINLAAVEEGPSKFQKELAFLGQHTLTEMKANGAVACDPKDVHRDAVNLSTLEVDVTAGGKTFTFKGKNMKEDNRQIGSNDVLQVFLDAKTLNKFLQSTKSSQATATFRYMTRPDTDVKTGKKLN